MCTEKMGAKKHRSLLCRLSSVYPSYISCLAGDLCLDEVQKLSALLKKINLHEQNTVTLYQVSYLSITVAIFTELFKLLKLGNFVEVCF